MKKNLMKTMTFAFAALGLGFAAQAAPTGGDVYEIERLTGDYGVTNGYPSAENPITEGGQEVRFVVHFAAADADENGTACTNKWYLEYFGDGSRFADDAMNPLRIGIVVSGKLRWATYREAYQNADVPYYYTNAHKGRAAIYDVVFSYVTQPGDYAMPIRLAQVGSTDDNPIAAFGSTANILFQNDNLWWFRNKTGDRATFTLVQPARRAQMVDRAGTWPDYVGDMTLAKANFFVRTVGFTDAEDVGDNWEKPGEYWRSVQCNSGVTGKPATIEVVSKSLPSEKSRLYVWTTNNTVVTMTGGKATAMGNPADDGETTISCAVATIDIVAGKADGYRIPLRGVAVSETPVEVFVSQYPGFRYDEAGDGSLLEDFMVIPVRCVEAPKPGVKISFDADVTKFSYNNGEAVVAPYDTAMETPIAMYVTLSDLKGLSATDFPQGVDVFLNPKLAKADYADVNVFSNNYITLSLDSADAEGKREFVHFEPGQYQIPVYLFVRGGDTKTASGITFNPTATNAAFNTAYDGDRTGAKINVRDTIPLLQQPADGVSVTADALGGFDLNVQVLDCYRDMMSTNFSVQVGTEKLTGVEFARDIATKCHFKSPGNEGEFLLPVVVTDQNNNSSTNKVTITVTVTPPKTVTCDFVATSDSSAAVKGTTYRENSNPTFAKVASGEILRPIPRFTLSDKNNSGKTLYAFLVPLSAAASNHVACAAFTEGVAIPLYETSSEPNDKFAMTFLDGCDETSYLEFGIVLRTGPSLTDPLYTEFVAPKNVNLTIKNVEPEILKFAYNNTKREQGDTVHVADGQPATFTVTVDDASKLDITNETQRIVTVWRFEDDIGNSTVEYITNTVGSTVTCQHTFVGGGTVQKVEVYAYDKDMDPETQQGASFSLYVAVDQAPFVYFTLEDKWVAEGGNRVDEATVYEDSAVKQRYAWLQLSSQVPAKYTVARPLVLELTVEKIGSTGAMTLDKTEVKIPAASNSKKTGGGTDCRITFISTEADKKPDGGEQDDSIFQITATPKWNGADDTTYIGATLELTVEGVAPKMTKPSDGFCNKTNDNIVAGAELKIPFAATDIDADKNLKVVVSGPSDEQEYNYVSGVDTNYTYTFADNDSGLQVITITVTDKDGYESTKTVYRMIPAFKTLRLTPYGAAPASQSRYNAVASGLGHGLVGADGQRAMTNDEGRVSAIYADRTNQGEAWARGLSGTETGGVAGFDSFFYTWVNITASASAGGKGTISVQAPNPTAKSETTMRLDVALDPYQAGKDTYNPVSLEAIFSREYLASDNMGDINADGIPDLFVKKYGFGIVGENGELTGDDLKAITAANNGNLDQDYLPSGETSRFGTLIPQLKETWVTVGTPFTARLELRGYHDGFNDAPGVLGLDVKSDRIYEVTNALGQASYDPEKCTISLTEYLAWKDSGLPADKWSPECPTDPTLEDTDDDGLPDGYEYYFWYLAHVGYMDGLEHKYLTGSRYDPLHPGEPIVIPASEIAALFNPRAKYGEANESQLRDTDNDGLPDLLEFEIGTNPIEWDTDGDGLPDGYEVMLQGKLNPDSGEYDENASVNLDDKLNHKPVDPLLEATTVSLMDGMRNYDGDYMAFSTNVAMEVFATTSGWYCVAAKAGFSSNHVVLASSSADLEAFALVKTNDACWAFTLKDGSKYVTTVDLGVGNRGNVFYEYPTGTWRLRADLNETNTWVATTYPAKDGVPIRGLGANLPRGAVLKDFASITNVTVDTLLVNYTTQYTDETTGATAVSNRAPWTAGDGLPNRLYHAWKYGVANAEKTLYGGWALGGDAFVTNYVPVLRPAQAATVYRYHHQVFATDGFDPRTGWTGGSEIGIDWLNQEELTGAATNKMAAVNSREYHDYDEFLLMAFYAQVGQAADALIAQGGKAADYEFAVRPVDITPVLRSKLYNHAFLWSYYCTNPENADTDEDGVPDGWELYVMGGPKKSADKLKDVIPVVGRMTPYSPFIPLFDVTKPDADGDGLDEQAEFCGTDSVKAYESVSETIVNVNPNWSNKRYPTDPWNADTDDDGISDGAERDLFAYGPEAEEGKVKAPGAGGGLNPLSWDTDGDGLPDPWERDFAGHYIEGDVTSQTVSTNGTNTVTITLRSGGGWTGGMDGTVADATEDYDADGLLNWQEYMVGAMRCWRYDDTWSSWESHVFDPMSVPAPGTPEWNEFWFRMLLRTPQNRTQGETFVYNPHGVSGTFDFGASYFSLCTNEWDTAKGGYYMFHDGIYHDLAKPGPEWSEKVGDKTIQYSRFFWWVWEEIKKGAMFEFAVGENDRCFITPKKYICCDPCNPDTDYDGMDDYYELYHGMNPLLGDSGRYDNGHHPPIDVIYVAWGGGAGDEVIWSAENNFWYGYGISTSGSGATLARRPLNETNPAWPKQSTYDFVAYPWLGGLAAADPDGDNNRNQIEAIMPKLQSASSWLHTDPTPLWMTDSSDAGSLTCRYYVPIEDSLSKGPFGGKETFEFDANGDGKIDPKTERWKFTDFPGISWNAKTGVSINPYVPNEKWGPTGWAWDFEENEGYDSDHDYLNDFEEQQGKSKSASDPQDSDSPLRRQAMWFDGERSFLETPLVSEEQEPYVLPNPSEMPYLYFTVECWAKAEDPTKEGLQTLVERAIMTGQSNLGDRKFLRKNFLIGIKGGRWYAKFDSTGTDKNQPVEITDGPDATAEWTHVAATFDGKDLRLFVNGTCVKEKATSIQPEHGTAAVTMTATGLLGGGNLHYTTYAILVGASAANQFGVVWDYQYRFGGLYETSFEDYEGYFKGWIDEVRIWDGARSKVQIGNDCRKRYTAQDALDNRLNIYAAWREGVSLASDSPRQAELRHHFTFDHLPGAVDVKDVMKVPAGFTAEWNVTDAKAIWSRPEGWVCPWWAYGNSQLQSHVYSERAWVPWVNNTVEHLPRFDDSTLDSVYWGKTWAGATNSVDLGWDEFKFPLTHEVSSRRQQMGYDIRHQPPYTTPTRHDMIASNEEQLKRFTFAHRHRVCEGGDLLVFGNAFPKRTTSLWDDTDQAMDAWWQTGKDEDDAEGDTNLNGLPDWWEKYARRNYAHIPVSQPLGWDSTVVREGVSMPAWQAYQRDLAAGMLPDGNYHDEYKDRVDNDHDGLYDWWEEYWRILELGGDDDPDLDGLSNYAEFMVTEGDAPYGRGRGFPEISPKIAHSTGLAVTDYFLPGPATNIEAKGKHVYANEYLGEIFTDHDFMEDWWEAKYANNYVNRRIYDPLDDREGDGWSNWAECRYSLWSGYCRADTVDYWTDREVDGQIEYSGLLVKGYPQPGIGITVTYRGVRDLTGKPITVRVSSGKNRRADATFVIPTELRYPPQGQEMRVKYIGGFSAESTLHGFLNEGNLNPNLVVFERALAGLERSYKWDWSWYDNNQIMHPQATAGNLATFKKLFAEWPQLIYESSQLDWVPVSMPVETSDGGGAVEVLDLNTMSVIGTVDLTSGEYTFDAAAFAAADARDTNLANSIFRVKYATRLGNSWPQTIWVSAADIGYVREGNATIEVFVDAGAESASGESASEEGSSGASASGVYHPGDPFGVIRNVDIGWHKASGLVVELTDVSPVVPRYDIASGACDRTVVKGDSSGVEAVKASTNGVASAGADEKASTDTGLAKTIRIVRSEINGLPAKDRTVMGAREYVMDDRSYLHEGDVLTDLRPDLDWEYLAADAKTMFEDAEAVTSAKYTIEQLVVRGDGVTTNLPLATFVRNFSMARAKGAPVSPISSEPVYSASPEFEFTMGDETITAFEIQVAKVEAAGKTNVIWTTGVKTLPGRTPSVPGAYTYRYQPWIYADAPITTNGAPVFADGQTYAWRVAFFNAKYAKATLKESDWSAWGVFQMDVANKNRYPDQPTSYGNVAAAVRYFGPYRTTNDIAKLTVVEVYDNAAFRGRPLAQKRLASADDLTNRLDVATEDVVFHGVTPGTVYVRAYIDLNNDGVRQSWEPWGYANQVDKSLQALYNPVGAKVDASVSNFRNPPHLVVFIEDTDANKNEIPDCFEDASAFSSIIDQSGTGGTGGGTTGGGGDADGDGIPGTTESDIGTDPNVWDTDRDGMPDGWEYLFADDIAARLGPLEADGEIGLDADTMAYAEEMRTLVTVRRLADGTDVNYILPRGMAAPVNGDEMSGKTLDVAYEYFSDGSNKVYGVGREVKVPNSMEMSLLVLTNTVSETAVTNIWPQGAAAPEVGAELTGTNVWTCTWDGGKGLFVLGSLTNLALAVVTNVDESTVPWTTNVVKVRTFVKEVATTNVFTGLNRVVNAFGNGSVTVALVHAQVYDRFGYEVGCATPLAGAPHTKKFTARDKYLVVRYLEALGLADEAKVNREKLWANYTLKPGVIDGDQDGAADGWELYVMFGTNGINSATTLAAAPISPWNFNDRTSDQDKDTLDLVHEYARGLAPTDPWDPYSMWKNLSGKGDLLAGTTNFTDAAARAFGVTPDTVNDDDDLDLVTNLDELRAYYRDPTALGDLSVSNAWSNGSTPDYFRACGSKYLGALFNGAEFIEPAERRAMNVTTLARSGTRDYRESGWDAWSTARYSILNAEQTLNVEGVVSDELMLIIRYWNVIRPGEFKGTTVGEAMDFFHEVWAGVQRLIDYDGNVAIEAKKPSLISGWGTIHDADAAQTTTQVVAFFGGQAKMEEVIAKNKKDLTAEQVVTPEPAVNLLLKYAGNESYDLVLEAYQVNSAYPEYGEQLTARWTTPVTFDSGITKVNGLRTPASGSLKQGQTRFVAYIDADGNGKLSSGDTYGTAKVNVGYLGADVTICLGEANEAAYPIISLADGSNTVSTIALVRSAINGKPLYNDAVGAFVVQFPNNAGREALCPEDYVMSGHVGIDKTLSSLANVGEIESVTYEVLRLTPEQVPLLSITNLNHYVYSGTNGAATAMNEEVTIRYSLVRDIVKAIAVAGNTADDVKLSFTVPTDTANSRFWLSVTNETTGAASVYGGEDGFVLTGARDGVVVLDSDWMEENTVNISTGRVSFAVVLGNDKYGKPGSFAGAPAATMFVNAGRVYDGEIVVDVASALPGVTFADGVTVAAYARADLANPVAVTNDCASGVVTLKGLRAGTEYYVAAWYVKDPQDGRADASERRPYDTWGYVTLLGEAANGFDAKAVKAVDPANRMIDVPVATNLVFLQDTDWNDNGVLDREEHFSSKDGTYVKSVKPTYGLKINGLKSALFSDADEGDVMAYAVVNFPCVATTNSLGETVWYVIYDLGKETTTNMTADGIRKGTPLSELKTLHTTYWYDESEGVAQVLALGRETTVAGGAKVMQSATKPIVLVHAQVYAKFGFNPLTANGSLGAGAGVNTKPFDSTDKAYVVNYLRNVLRVADAADFSLVDAKNNTYPDADFVAGGRGDGIPDGWELYVMFGTKPISDLTANDLTNAPGKVHSPWNYADRAADLDKDGLDQLHEYDGGYLPTDPWSVDTDKDGVIDLYAYEYHLKGDDAGKDFDGDGLSNYAEYLASEAFQFTKCDPEKYATSDGICDYFRKVGDLYLGEIFMDHDQVDDAWEHEFAKGANMYVYDPFRDDDNDGWSNYAESKVGTDPTEISVLGVTGANDSTTYTKNEYPIPVITAKVVYNGNDVNVGSVVFKAWNDAEDPEMTSAPDATWTIGNGGAKEGGDSDVLNPSTETASTAVTPKKYIGRKPSGVQTYQLSGGSIKSGSVTVHFLDQQFLRYDSNDVAVARNATSPKDANWYAGVWDKNGKLYDYRGREVGSVDYSTGRLTLDCDKFTGAALGLPNSTDSDTAKLIADKATAGNTGGLYYDTISLDNANLLLSWNAVNVTLTANGTYYLADADAVTATAKSHGHVREGRNSFICFADTIEANGEYDPGEPFGVVRGVDVGWQGAKFTVELSETSAITPRVNIWASETSDRSVTFSEYAAMPLTDRMATPEQLAVLSNKVQAASAEETKARLRVVRFGVNGMYAYRAGVGFNVSNFIDRVFDKNGRSYLCEADFLRDGEFDIEWSTLSKQVIENQGTEMAVGEVTNMTYLAVLEGGSGFETWIRSASDSNTVIRALGATIERRFERTKHAPQAENVDAICYGARPTFRWSLPNEEPFAKKYGTSYTAFKLKIFAEDGVTKIYDSGIRRAPVQDAKGVFAWTADASVGDLLATRQRFKSTGNFTWQVAMYNAKFVECTDDKFYPTEEKKWKADKPSALAAFSVAVNAQQEVNDHQYSSIDVTVKYAGPAAVIAKYADLTTLEGKVRVQAFATADFAGEPLSETVVTTKVADLASATANARLVGLDATGTYYIRAYIDSDGDHMRSAWESWGSAKTPVVLSTALRTAPLVGVWIEDCDVDNDWMPDAWEYVKFGEIAEESADVMEDGKTIFTTDTIASVKLSLASISTGLEGASLTIFENGSWAKQLLGLSGTTSITFDDIRAAVQHALDVKSGTFKITSLTLGADGKVTLTVDAEVAPTIAGTLLTSVYDVTPATTKTVTLNVYRKANLATADWGNPVKTKTVSLGAGEQEIRDIDVGVTAADLKGGFYKIDIVE